ncbi:MAG TPA: hypothetical protein VFM52_05415 [Rhodanobacter sp.]|nr:hypothetical protein [Rhodanobacter sp.]
MLFERPLRNARGHFFHAELDRQYVNGCFVRAKAPPGQDAGMYPQSFFSWALRDGAAELQLERSPDAGYEVRLELAPKGLSGTGMVWGAAVGPLAPGATPPPRDEVAAERLGDPDIKRCAPLPREDFL